MVDGPAQISREGAGGSSSASTQDATSAASSPTCASASIARSSCPRATTSGGGIPEQSALGHLTVIEPVTIAAIFPLFVPFDSVRFAALIITVLPFASIGGVVGLYLSGEYLSVPASVGFIALWGIAVLNGVVLVSFIRKLRADGRDVAQAVAEGAASRWPVLMTAIVAMLGGALPVRDGAWFRSPAAAGDRRDRRVDQLDVADAGDVARAVSPGRPRSQAGGLTRGRQGAA
ncbi:MAG: efflux RND transporter permease subunit [Burkholderiaceae bacterium]